MLLCRSLFLAFSLFMVMLAICGSATAENTASIQYNIGISQIVEHPALDAVRLGMLAALKDQGFVEGTNLVVHYENAQGNLVTATQIATQLLSTPSNVLVGISTPSAQTLFYGAQRNGKNTPIIFTAVSDPIAAKLEPGDANYPITGVTDRPNMEGLLEVFQALLPRAKNLGVLYNPSESNSVSTIGLLKQLIEDKQLTDKIKLLEVTVNSTSDVAQAMKSLMGKVDALYFPQDNTVVSAIETVVSIAGTGLGSKNAKPLPLFCSDPLLVKRGVLAAVGYDYTDVGRETGNMVARVLQGEEVSLIPVRTPDQLKTVFNKTLIKSLGLTVPEKLQYSEISFSD